MEEVRLAGQRLARKPEAAERERGARYLFAFIRRRALSHPPSASATSSTASSPESSASFSSRALLYGLKEPTRSLAGLFYLTSQEPADLSRILGLSVAEMATRLHALRRALAPELGLEPPVGIARDVCQLERPPSAPTEASVSDSSVADARLLFDQKILADFSTLEPTSEEAQELLHIAQSLESRSAEWKPSLKDPALLGLTCGLLLLLGVVAWIFLSSAQEFTGLPVAESLITQGAEVSAQEFEPVQVPLAELGDWLALQGIQGFWVPTGFDQQETLAARIFSVNGAQVASVLLPQNHLMVYLFDGKELGVEVHPEGEWQFFSAGQDVGAIAQKGHLCFLVAYRGSAEELQGILQSILPRS